MNPQPLNQLMAPDWAQALAPVEPQIRQMGDFLRQEHAAGRQTLPAGPNILRAFSYPLSSVKVLLLGQDPYPTPGHAMGLSFSVQPQVRPLPRSLQNIYREMEADLGLPSPQHGDLSAWAQQGVLMLNRVLTVGAGAAGSHRGQGWEEVTEQAIRALAQRGTPLVGLLWGGRTPASAVPCWPTTPVLSPPTPLPYQLLGVSLAPGPLAGSISCCLSRGPSLLTGVCPAK